MVAQWVLGLRPLCSSGTALVWAAWGRRHTDVSILASLLLVELWLPLQTAYMVGEHLLMHSTGIDHSQLQGLAIHGEWATE